MNNLIYILLEKANKNKEFPNIDSYIEYLYSSYINLNFYKNYEINISKSEFKTLINSIYDVLKYKLTKEEFEKVCFHYIKLLVSDAIENKSIDITWSINHICYLTLGFEDIKIRDKYKDTVLFIQDKLIKDFVIKETKIEKVKRKIYTDFIK